MVCEEAMVRGGSYGRRMYDWQSVELDTCDKQGSRVDDLRAN